MSQDQTTHHAYPHARTIRESDRTRIECTTPRQAQLIAWLLEAMHCRVSHEAGTTTVVVTE